jgi:hypothetical protein
MFATIMSGAAILMPYVAAQIVKLRARHLHAIVKLLGHVPVAAGDQGSVRRDVAAERARGGGVGFAIQKAGDPRTHRGADDVLSDLENVLAGLIGEMRIERADAA